MLQSKTEIGNGAQEYEILVPHLQMEDRNVRKQWANLKWRIFL